MARLAGDLLVSTALALMAAVAAGAAASAAEPQPTACDLLASHPEDPDRVAPGIARRDIVDLPRTVQTCRADLKAAPGNARLNYQLARVLFYAGQAEEAIRRMQEAADAGHRQAQFVYGLMISNRRVPTANFPCDAELYWRRAARAGHQAARVSQARLWLKHVMFLRNYCRDVATPAEVRAFLDEAAKAAGNYYEGMLIEDLGEKLGLVEQQLTGSNQSPQVTGDGDD